MGIDEQIHAANPDYRFYKCDSSIEGRHNLWLTLKGEAKGDWFLQDEILDAEGNDLRQPLYVTATGATFEEALSQAIQKLRRKQNDET